MTLNSSQSLIAFTKVFLKIQKQNHNQPASGQGIDSEFAHAQCLFVMIACTWFPQAGVYTCLHSCLEIETPPRPCQWPEEECQQCFAKRKPGG